MAESGDLVGVNGETLFVGADHEVVYRDTDNRDMTGWTTKLEIRETDTSSGAALVDVDGVVGGVYSSTPASNTQVVTFALAKELLATTIFPKDDRSYKYAIWRTDSGTKQPLRHGKVPLIRVVQI